ncbi:MAG: hypothetical protein R3195_18985 [Gemmatimonadota bacterium]|nr:hypothetical protein [Gemmatimonadota bacterium]
MHDTHSMHVDDGALLALIDGELAPDDEARPHIGSCDECSRKLDELRFVARRVTGALEALDTPTPLTVAPVRPVEVTDASVTPITAARGAARPGRRPARSVAAAAGLVLVLAAGAYAIPGSPVRSAVDRTVEAIFGGDAGPVDPGPTQVAVEPAEGAVRVVIEQSDPELRVTVRVVATPTARVSARDARFGIESGEIRVSGAGGDLTVELPSAASGTVELDGVPIARALDGVVTRLDAADDVAATIIVEAGG